MSGVLFQFEKSSKCINLIKSMQWAEWPETYLLIYKWIDKKTSLPLVQITFIPILKYLFEYNIVWASSYNVYFVRWDWVIWYLIQHLFIKYGPELGLKPWLKGTTLLQVPLQANMEWWSESFIIVKCAWINMALIFPWNLPLSSLRLNLP